MKTVMKKMFSLLLVAVLLVGVMPFQASAADSYIVVWVAGASEYVTVDLDAGTYTADQIRQIGYSGNVEGYSLYEGSNDGQAPNLAGTTDINVTAGKFYTLMVTPAAEPDVCGQCGGAHKTDECTLKNCTVCNAWTDHETSAHCGYKGCVDRTHVAADHCTECDALKSVCPVTCPGNVNYAPPVTTATVTVIINNVGTGDTFTIDAGKNADEVYAAFQASSLAAKYDGAHGPVLTLADTSTAVTDVEADKAYWLWLSLDVSDDPVDDPADDPADQTCTDCLSDPCICCDKCGGTTSSHNAGCPQLAGMVKVYLHPNYDYPYEKGESMAFVWAEPGDLLKDIVATIPTPDRDKHMFQYWTTDVYGTDVINQYNTARVTTDGVVIYAQWADIVQSADGQITLRVDLNYGDYMGESITNIVRGAQMGNVLEHVDTPLRWNYKFVGWYWDENCTHPVDAKDRLYANSTIFAKWDRRYTNNEIMLKLYLNGDTKTVAQIIDIYDYAKDDGYISMSEVKKVVKQYYTGKNSDGLYFEGLFDSSDWGTYVANNNYDGRQYIKANMDNTNAEDTVVYVMVHNAKYGTSSNSSSSANADSSNPKTGDAIMTYVIILGASAGALATLFYLNKKRSV